jgi:hypothetical protein
MTEGKVNVISFYIGPAHFLHSNARKSLESLPKEKLASFRWVFPKLIRFSFSLNCGLLQTPLPSLRHEGGGPKASYVAGLQLMRKMHESHVYG